MQLHVGLHIRTGRSNAPFIEVAKRITDALEFSLDYLADDAKNFVIDKKTLLNKHDIKNLEPVLKNKLIFLADAVIRDATTV